MGSKTRMINGEMITEFAKDTDTSNKAIFKQALLETVVEVGGQVLSGLFWGKITPKKAKYSRMMLLF